MLSLPIFVSTGYIGIEHPVDPSLPQPEGERVQRVVLAASGPESVAESQKLSLVDRRQNRHHRRLDDLILQCGDAERSQPAIRLQYVPTTRGQSPIRARMDAFGNPEVRLEVSRVIFPQ